MMKTKGFNFIPAVLSLLMISCGNNTQLLAPQQDDDGPLKYKISGLKDTSMERIGETKYFFLVEKLSGTPEIVTLAVDSLPKGMQIKFDPTGAEMPSYNTSIVIKSVRVKEGVYPVNIRSVSPATGVKNNYINVTIKPYTNAAVGLAGEFMEKGQCNPYGSINDNVNVVVHETVKNRIVIRGLFSGVMINEIYADLNPATNTLSIPKQVMHFLTYEGEGSYDDDKIVINYTINGVNVNETCSTTLTRM